jgi:hypothetical protein
VAGSLTGVARLLIIYYYYFTGDFSRKVQPYDAYDQVEFDIPVGVNGDCCEFSSWRIFWLVRHDACSESLPFALTQTIDTSVECKSSESRFVSLVRYIIITFPLP